MLEILLLIYLCKHVGRKLRDKGRSPGMYQFLLVALWFGGEIFGAIVAVAVLGLEGAGGYLGALVGAPGGATIAFVIANSLPPAAPAGPPGFAVVPVPPGRDPSEL
jgi:hypothetical protein